MELRTMGKLQKYKLIFHTVRFMTPRQWKYRLWYLARNKVLTRKSKIHAVNSIRPINQFYKNVIADEKRIGVADLICKGTFNTVSSIQLEFNNQIDWDMKDYPYRLVVFRLNSFRWLLDLSAAYKTTGDDRYLIRGFSLIDDWQEKNGKLIKGDKWNPYVIADRLMNWIGFCSECSDVCGKNILIYAGFIASQADELCGSIEFQLGANHLLSEARALMYAGAFLNDDRLYSRGKQILSEEFNEQFLGDGSHYEQSISYHVESLQQYFETLVLMQIVSDDDAELLAKKLTKPYQYLNDMICADGTIPLVNDAAYDYPFDATDFLNTANMLYNPETPNGTVGDYSIQWNFVKDTKIEIDWKKNAFHENSGYLNYEFELNGKRYSVFFDAGNGGPDLNQGHAHADALNVLLSSESGSILVDSGVFTYMPGPDRMQCRSTKAHNALEIDGVNNAEVWSAFKMARRGHTKVNRYEDNEKALIIDAEYDGYKKLLKNPVTHTRRIEIDRREGIIEITDHLSSVGKHHGNLYFHLAPECKPQFGKDGLIEIGNISMDCSEPMKMEPCQIARSFGIKEEATCISIGFDFIGNKSVKTRFAL